MFDWYIIVGFLVYLFVEVEHNYEFSSRFLIRFFEKILETALFILLWPVSLYLALTGNLK